MESRWQKLKSRLIDLSLTIKSISSKIFNNINNIIYIIFGIIIVLLFLKIGFLQKEIQENNIETINLLNESLKIDNSYLEKIQNIDKKYEQEIIKINKNYIDSKLELEKIKELKQKQFLKASYERPDEVAKEIADEFDFDLVNLK